MKKIGNSTTLSRNDFLKAYVALKSANVKEPYIAVCDPKWAEEDVVKILGRYI